MKPIPFCLAAALVLSAHLQAADAAKGPEAGATPTPTVDQILDRYLEAAGGRVALEKLKSRHWKGEIEVGALGISGPFEVWSKTPNKEASKIEFGGFGSIREGYDGVVAWTQAPGQGVRVKSGGELARVQRSKLFPRELRFKEGYARWESKGPAKIGDAETWVVEAAAAEGKPDRLYFDQKSGLLVREESSVDTPLGDMTFQIDLGDYREVDGVKVAFSMKVPKPAELGFHIKFSEVKHNIEVADAEFAKPKE